MGELLQDQLRRKATTGARKNSRKNVAACPAAVRSFVGEIEPNHIMSSSNPTSPLQPYLFFSGRCEEALEFYRTALGAEVVMLMRFEEAPDAPPPGMVPPGWERKVMHSCVRIGEATLMASDGCGQPQAFSGFTLSLTLTAEAEVDRAFAALAEGGEVRMPLGETFWSPRFGMVQDRFGVGWMISLPVKDCGAESVAEDAAHEVELVG